MRVPDENLVQVKGLLHILTATSNEGDLKLKLATPFIVEI